MKFNKILTTSKYQERFIHLIVQGLSRNRRLRGGVVVSLVDSLNTTIDSGYSLAEVEGLTHLDIKGVFKCNASSGTLKPPYKFSIVPRGLPSTQVFGYESPVTLKFIESAPAPKPSVTPAPSASPTASETYSMSVRF
jgi:hypothetical protein